MLTGGELQKSFIMKFVSSLFLFCALTTFFAMGADSATPPFIILKLDDVSSPTPAWERTLKFLEEKGIKSALGIVAASLDRKNSTCHDWLKELQAKGLVEFWNHGLDHKQWKEGDKDVSEFKGTTYEHQKEHFERAQQLSKELLGQPFSAFGAPFNETDDATKKVLSENPDLKVWLYGKPIEILSGVIVIDRTPLNIENPTFVPNLERVKKSYESRDTKRDIFVMQGHPNAWNDERFADFVKIVEYLQEQGVIFTTPSQYYQHRQSLKEKAGQASLP